MDKGDMVTAACPETGPIMAQLDLQGNGVREAVREAVRGAVRGGVRHLPRVGA